MASGWDSLSSTQAQYVAELAAGKRQANVFLSLMSNWESADEALKNAMDSNGSAAEEQERYLNSILGKTELLNSAFQELSAGAIDSGFIKFLIDASTATIKLVDNFGIFNVAFGALMGAIAMKQGMTLGDMFKGAASGAKVLSGMIKGITVDLTSQQKTYMTLTTLSKKQALTTAQRVTLQKATNSLSKQELATSNALIAKETALNTLKSIGNGLATAGVGILASMAVSAVFSKIGEMADPIKKVNENLEEQKTKLEDISSKYEELRKKPNITAEEEKKLQILKKQLNIQENITKAANREKADSIKNDGEGFGLGYSQEDRAKQAISTYEKVEERVGEYRDALLKLDKTSVNYEEEVARLNNAIKQGEETMKDSFSTMSDYYTETEDLTDVMEEGSLAARENIEAIIERDVVMDSASNSTTEANEALNSLGDSTEFVSSTFGTFKDSVNLITTAYKEMSAQGYLSVDTVMAMVEAGGQYLDLLTLENGQYSMNADAMNAMFEMKKADAIAEIQQKKMVTQTVIDFMEAEISAYEISGKADKAKTAANKANALATLNFVSATALGVNNMLNATAGGAVSAMAANANDIVKSFDGISNSEELSQYKNVVNTLKGNMKQYDAAVNVLSNQSLPSYTNAMGNASKATDGARGSTDGLKSSVDALKESLEQAKDELSNMEDAYEAMQKAIVNQLEKEIGLEKEKLEALKKQKEYYEAMQGVAGDIIDEQIKKIQDEIKALDKEKEKQDEILALQEAQLEAQKAKDAYEAAKSNKNTRVYSAEVGWKWSSDPSQVQSTLESLQEAQKNLSELQKEQELAHKKQDLEGQIEELEELKDAWTKNLDDINDAIKNSEEVQRFYDEFFKASNEERKVMLEEFTKKYSEEVANQITKTDESIAKLEDLKEQWSKAMDIEEDISKYAGAQEWLKKFEGATYEERKVMLGQFTTSWKDYYSQQTAKIAELQRQVDATSGSLNNMAGAAAGASSALAGLAKASSDINKIITGSVLIERDGYLIRVTTYWDGTTEEKNIGKPASGSKNEVDYIHSGGSISKYAEGGVDNFGGHTGLVDWTGAWDSNKWVDGTPNNKEVILNNKQASEILYRMANQPIINNRSGDTSVRNSDTTVINSLTIQAKDGDTLDRLLTQAKNIAKTK